MHPDDRELLIRIAPAYIIAGVACVVSILQIRDLKRRMKLKKTQHEALMEEIKDAHRERMERHEAWLATQPKTVQDYIQKTKETIGSLDDTRHKMNDPNHIWEL